MPRRYRNQTVPAAEAAALVSETAARAEGAPSLGGGGGRSVELSHIGVAVSVRTRGIFLSPPFGDDLRKSWLRGTSQSWTPVFSGMEERYG